MSIDRLSDMLNKIKNISMVGKTSIELSYTKQCEEVAKVLKDAGYLSEVKVFKEAGLPYKSLRIDLAKDATGIKITDVKRISKPGRRIYKPVKDIKTVESHVVYVVSTSRGVMNGADAKKRKLGGEVICVVKG